MTSVEIELLPLERSSHVDLSAADAVNKESDSTTDQDDPAFMDDETRTAATNEEIYHSNTPFSIKGMFMLAIFTSLVMVAGILIVYYKSPKPPGRICTFVLKSEAQNSIGQDSHPYSIAVGDFNNDGFPDLVVPNSGTNNIGIFLRRDSNSFLEQTTYSTGSGSIPYAVAVGDFNQDQRMDIAVANSGSNSIGLFLGIGNGSFTIQRTFSTGSSRPRWVAVGDFNNDTQLDLVVVNYGTNSMGILLGNGNGSFTDSISFPTGFDSIPYSLSVADLNKDNILDIVVANNGTNNVGIFFGRGNGRFATQITLHTGIGSLPYSIAIADLNNDTCMDLVVVCFGSNNVNVYLGFGNSTFILLKKYSTGNYSAPRSVTVGDFDNDGKLDIAVANYETFRVGILYGYGSGNFADEITYYTDSDSKPYSLTTGAFNNDTRLDIAVVNYDYNYVDLILTYRNYCFLDQIAYPTTGIASGPSSIALGDFNNDNQLDIVVTNTGTDCIGVLLNYDTNTFSKQVLYWTGSGSTPDSVAVGDFNNDTQLDIVVANYGTNNIGVFLGIGDGTFTSYISYSTGSRSKPYSVTVGDVNNDQQLDIIVINYRTNNVGVFVGYGNGSFARQMTYSTGSGSQPNSVVVGDLNNDKQLDIIVANYGTNNVGILLGIGNGTFLTQTILSTGTSSEPVYVAIADLNNDNILDIIVVNNGINNVGVFLGKGDGTFLSQITYSTGSDSSPLSVGIADFNNDKQLDIVVTNYQANNLGFFLGYGNGSFSPQLIYLLENDSGPYPVVVGDLNNDNQTDVVVGDYGTSDIGVVLGYGNDSFSSLKSYSTQNDSHPAAAVVGDFNNDTRLDIIVVNYGSNNIDIFLGHGDGTLSKQTTYSTGSDSAPYSIAVGDFNGDNRLDIVVANYGTGTVGVLLGYGNGTFTSQKTYSTGNSSGPNDVAVGDFNNDTRLDIAVVNYNANNFGIFLGNGDGTFSNQTTFSTGRNSIPQTLVVADFNHDNRLDIAVVNTQNDNFGVFLGFGNGSFSNQTTYPSGPGTETFSIAASDLNNDGHLDLVVTIYYTRAVAIYLGCGNGTFVSRATYSAGSTARPVWVAIGDLNNDNQSDIVVANGDSDNIVVFFGNGDGTFINARTYSTGNNSYPNFVTIGDFNNDGLMDVVVANWNSNVMGIFVGSTYINGIREGTYSTGSAPHPQSLALGDFNHDTQLDISIAIYGLDNVGILLGQPNGSFPSQTMFSTGELSFPTSVALADVNNDTQLDIIVANSVTDSIGILYGYYNGSFEDALLYPIASGSNPQSIGVGDFNNDKKLDIVVANSGTDNILTLLKYDTGAFQEQRSYLTESDSTPRWVSTGDFNMDGWLDFVVVNSGNNNIGVFLALDNGSFADQIIYSTGIGSNSWSNAVADLNNDTCLDILVGNSWGDNIGIFLGFCNGTFSNQTTYSTGHGSGPEDIAVADLNNDGQLDIVTVLQFTNGIAILYGYGNGTFSKAAIYSTGTDSHPTALAIADLNNDKRLDIVVANYGVDYIVIFYGYANHTFSNRTTYSTGTNARSQSVATADLNNDGIIDIAVANSGTDNIIVFFGDTNGTFRNQMTLSTGGGSSPHGIIINDFNNDKQLDLAVTNYGSSTLGIFLGCINGTFFSQLTYSTGDSSQPFYLVVGDFNNDSRLDVIVANSGSDNVGLFLGYINEHFLVGPAFSTGLFSQPNSVAVADFDTDAQLDIVVANSGTDNIMILFGSGHGTFSKQINYSTGNDSQPCWVAVGDLNNDTRLDIVVANTGTNTIGIFLGNGTGTFSNQMTYFTGVRSQPYSVAILDFDNDTHLDIAVANYGANSVGVFLGYGNGSFADQLSFATGFGSRPFALAVGDVNKDNLTDIVATNNGYGNIDILMKTC